MSNKKTATLRDSIIDSIGNFLYEEGFKKDNITKFGILEIINLLSDYREEGIALYPEILITNNIDFFKTIPNKEIILRKSALSVAEFKNAIKLCAPLALNGWIIFIEVNKDIIKFGVTNAEMTDTSPSIYEQAVGELKIQEYENTTIAYIRNIGQKTVELSGLKNSVLVSLTLDEVENPTIGNVKEFCTNITSKCKEKFRVSINTFLSKTIDEALKTGHGNLIGVIDDDEKLIKELKEKIAEKGGVYLIDPIDFELLVSEAEENKSQDSTINLKIHSSILKSMLKHDGITILSNKAKVIGYHILIDNFTKNEDKIEGGARLKAFQSMQNCGMFSTCLYKSQDGIIKLWQK